MSFLKVKDWSSYQSYKDRKPPWIRLHKTMLDNYEFHAMSSEARALLPMLWLLASEDKDPVSGLIRDSYEKIAFRLRMDLKVLTEAITEIENADFVSLQVVENIECNETVTKPLQNRTQTVKKTETETETETEQTARAPVVRSIDPYWKESGLVDEYMAFKKMRQQTRKPINDVAASRLVTKHKKLVEEGSDPAELINLATERCWASFFPAQKVQEKVPDNIKDIRKLVREKNLTNLPSSGDMVVIRKAIAAKTGMAL